MYKVLVSDSVSQEALDVFKEYKDISVVVKTDHTPEELEAAIADYDALIVRSATKFKGSVIEKAKKMKVVGRAGAGVDNVDVPVCSKKGIVVMNTPGGNSAAVAELTIAYLLCMSRNIVPATVSTKEGKWDKNKLAKNSVEVAGKTLAIIGTGAIGSLVADKAKGLSMNVIAFDPYLSDEKAAYIGVTKVKDVEDIYKNADYISLHVPKNDQTSNMINKDSIAKMKKGVYIVNCARGGIINENDLLDALNSGKVQAAALDVFEMEPVDPNNPLLKHPNLICTPHLGASSVEAQVNVAIAIAKQLSDYLTTGEVSGAVKVPTLDKYTRNLLNPYISLAGKIGNLYRQFANLSVTEIEIEYSGEVHDYPINSITTSMLIGLFSSVVEGINFVNAQSIIKEMGIKIIETKIAESRDYASQISLRVKHSGGKTEIVGAVFKEGIYRIVGIDEFKVEFVPEGNLLLTINKDKPGYIGALGTVLGEANLNIANMELGRNNKGEAMSFVQIDGEIPDSVTEKISKIPALLKVFKIQMN